MIRNASNLKEFSAAVRLLSLLTLTLISCFTFGSPSAYAADPSGPVVVVFSNQNNTDPDEEDADIADTLQVISSSVTVFDGGDGTAAAWSTALSTADVLVFPEGSNFGTSAIDSSAAAFIKGWIEAGKIVVGTGSYTHLFFINYMTGLDYFPEFGNIADVNGNWDLQVVNPDLPTTVPPGNWTGGLDGFSLWSPEKKAFVTPVYYDADEDNLGVGYFTFGSGFYIYNAYDWYPDQGEITDGTRAAWDATLQFAAAGELSPPVNETPPPAPTLASTGADSNATAGLLLASVTLVFIGASFVGFGRIKISK